MYCPRCGQPRISDEVQYCSQCGLPLDGIAALLAAGGNLPHYEAEGSKLQRSAKKRGVQQGAKLLLLGMMLTPLLAILSEALGTPEALIALSAIIFFWGGILRIAYALIFERDTLRKEPGIRSVNVPVAAVPLQVNSVPRNAGLPASQSVRVPSFKQRRRDTAELVTPPSVTDHTTRLLKDKPDS